MYILRSGKRASQGRSEHSPTGAESYRKGYGTCNSHILDTQVNRTRVWKTLNATHRSVD